MNEAHTGFVAHAFNSSLGSEMIVGRIFLDRWRFHFRAADVTLDIPLPRLHVELPEGEDERVYFHDPAQPEWKIITPDRGILGSPALASAENVRSQLSRIVTRRELSSRLKITLACLAVCVVAAGLGWLAAGFMVRSMVRNIPAEWEQKLGDSLMKSLQEEVTLVDDSNQVARVTAAAAPLLRVLPGGRARFTFHLVQHPEPNAMALPGGHIIVHTGLLEIVDRPEELLGVIAHETAHVTEQHGFRKIISAAGPLLLFGVFLGGDNSVLGVLADNSAVLVQQSFSQEYETEADDVAWKSLLAANVDPRGLSELLFKLKAYEASQPFARAVPNAFSSHPALDKRIARLEAKWQNLPRKTNFVALPPLAWP
ncbi:MAG: M48 family metallopeptidase [Verrucomicrobia bacterium]|nr:M48 family metallopeptidase [Verrucomicrobiota bacterium]